MELNQCNEVKIFSYIFLCNIRASHHYPAKLLSEEFSEGSSGVKIRTRDFLSMGRQCGPVALHPAQMKTTIHTLPYLLNVN